MATSDLLQVRRVDQPAVYGNRPYPTWLRLCAWVRPRLGGSRENRGKEALNHADKPTNAEPCPGSDAEIRIPNLDAWVWRSGRTRSVDRPHRRNDEGDHRISSTPG